MAHSISMHQLWAASAPWEAFRILIEAEAVEAIASRLEAIASSLEAFATRLEAIATRVEAIEATKPVANCRCKDRRDMIDMFFFFCRHKYPQTQFLSSFFTEGNPGATMLAAVDAVDVNVNTSFFVV